MRFVLVLSLLAGCYAFEDDIDDTVAFTVEVRAGDTGAFDQVLVVPIAATTPSLDPILTPAILAGEPAPTNWVEKREEAVERGTLAPKTTLEFRRDLLWEPSEVTAVGFRNGAVTGWSVLVHTQRLSWDETHAVVTLRRTPQLELWGGRCLRLFNATQTTYLVISGDRDCDGQPDEMDCKPLAFCDPLAPTGAARDACVCP